jgi:hypothetical protein
VRLEKYLGGRQRSRKIAARHLRALLSKILKKLALFDF